MAVVEQTALIAVPNDYTKKVLESDVREHLVRALNDSLGRRDRVGGHRRPEPRAVDSRADLHTTPTTTPTTVNPPG
jgi:chromosomal replication initiation ATPase DnaA